MLGFFWQLARFALRARLRRDDAALQFARQRIWDLEAGLRHYAACGPLQLPQTSLEQLIPDDEVATRISDWRLQDGGTAPYESFCLAAITRFLKPLCVFEIGTFRGQTTALFAQNTPPEAHIYTLDLQPAEIPALPQRPVGGDLRYIEKERVGELIDRCPSRSKITQRLGDSTRFDFDPYAGQCHLVFVDAGHAYPYVKSDTENAFRLLAPGGVILWHDYKPGCPGVVQALHETNADRPLQHIAGTSLVVHGLTQQLPPQRESHFVAAAPART
jgi:predicted O-methyltransferase YrrM